MLDNCLKHYLTISCFYPPPQELKDEDGTKLVELPRNYLAMVETLIRKQRSESAVLQGWLGPRRFEDLPIAQLPDSHSDPKVQDGLGRIKELDEKLADKTMEALIVARETYPDKWAEVRQGPGKGEGNPMWLASHAKGFEVHGAFCKEQLCPPFPPPYLSPSLALCDSACGGVEAHGASL